MKFAELKKDIAEHGVRPVYLFEGEEVYFREKGKSMLKATISQPELNYSTFDKKQGLKTLADMVLTLPFLSDRRMVVAEEFYPTEKEFNTFLKPLFDTPVDTCVLVIVNSEKPKAGGCDLKRKSAVTYVDCARAEDVMVEKWIFLTFKQAGIVADGTVCSTIARYCVCNMARVEKEVEKLIEYVGAGGKVSLNDVEALVYKDSEYKLYELTQAAARRDYAAFMEIMNGMVGKGFDENAFLNSLCSYFRNLCAVVQMPGSNASVAEALGMKEYAVKKMREAAARFCKGQAQNYYTAVYGALCAVRSGEMTAEAALKTVIAKIFFENV